MINRGEVKEDRNRGREGSALLNGSAVREMRKKIGKKIGGEYKKKIGMRGAGWERPRSEREKRSGRVNEGIKRGKR